MMKKKENTCLKSIILKFFDIIPMILILIFLNFWANKFAHINITWRKCRNKGNNEAINKVHEDFKKIVAVTKLKELKRYAENILQITKNEKHTIKDKTYKN